MKKKKTDTQKNGVKKLSAWLNVCEHVPPEGKLVLAYDEVDGVYCLAKWSAAAGWLTQLNSHLDVVTHWNDMELPLVFEIKNSRDSNALLKYGLPFHF